MTRPIWKNTWCRCRSRQRDGMRAGLSPQAMGEVADILAANQRFLVAAGRRQGLGRGIADALAADSAPMEPAHQPAIAVRAAGPSRRPRQPLALLQRRAGLQPADSRRQRCRAVPAGGRAGHLRPVRLRIDRAVRGERGLRLDRPAPPHRAGRGHTTLRCRFRITAWPATSRCTGAWSAFAMPTTTPNWPRTRRRCDFRARRTCAAAGAPARCWPRR